MELIRPIKSNDLQGLLRLAREAGFGLTSLPPEEELLARKVGSSVRSFAKEVYQPGPEYYLFVMEDESDEIIGTSGIYARVGGYEPWYAYKLETALHESASLGIRREMEYLKLHSVHSGPSMVGTLLLSLSQRKKGRGRLLSLARFMFMAEFPELFQPGVTAEMRGVSDLEGRSPFWDSLGKHFFDMDFPMADYQSALDKSFIAELMPIHPIYTALLSPEAREALGEVHPDTRGALRILEQEGFRKSKMVDIFDAGPHVNCPVRGVRTVRNSRRAKVIELADEPGKDEIFMVATTNKAEFRLVGARLANTGFDAVLDRTAAARLGVKVGDEIRFSALYP